MTATTAARRRPRVPPAARWWAAGTLLLVAVVYVLRAADGDAVVATWRQAAAAPGGAVVALMAYALAFVVRAHVWRRVLPGLPFGHALAALHVSLAGNHVLPLRLGEALRVTSVVRRARVPLDAATASTLTLRGADILAVAGLGAALGPAVAGALLGGWTRPLLAVVLALSLAGVWWLSRLRRSSRLPVRLPGLAVALGTLAAWVLEAGVLWQAAAWAGIDLAPREAVLVTAVTIAAQALAVTPGGIGTYEAAATAALVTLGADPGAGLAAALTAHALKTAYALVTGAVAVVLPAPGMLGRLRLAPAGAPARAPVPDGHVALLLPAHDEAGAVGDVVARVPESVCGRAVRCTVVDDGSVDATAALARAAGCEVVSLGRNRGLGAAVRHGLAHAVAGGAAVVAFCDADGEYAPEELDRLVAPILAGRADYVVGSRFHGDIRRMLPHRRLGNVALTTALRFVARAPISDGQSGYRALSRAAAADAEIVHDFNYAQVLTLDLLGKGWRYAEVPISYAFRTTGRSFVRLGRYLRCVVPAVHAELNAP